MTGVAEELALLCIAEEKADEVRVDEDAGEAMLELPIETADCDTDETLGVEATFCPVGAADKREELAEAADETELTATIEELSEEAWLETPTEAEAEALTETPTGLFEAVEAGTTF